MELKLLLISRDDILRTSARRGGQRVFRLLAQLNRAGFQLLATAPQPDHWSEEHGGPDETLLGPDSLRQRLNDAGGTLDGVYYVRRSSFTQKRNRESALQDMMERYVVSPAACHLYSSSRKFVDAANGMGIHATYLGEERELIPELRELLKGA